MAVKRKNTGLGKGLDALFGEIDQMNDDLDPSALGVESLNIDFIKPNKAQPRKTFNEESLNELALSIEQHGIIQPIIVRPVDEGYEIVAGERRYRAARKVGLKEVPCIVRQLTDEENMLFAIIENMQREDLNPVEEAEGIEKMVSTFGLTQLDVSKSIGKSRPYIANMLRILKLPEPIKEMMSNGNLSSGHGRTLLGVSDTAKQADLAKRVVEEGLSVRALEEIVKAVESGEERPKRPVPRKIRKSSDVVVIEEELKTILGTKVNLNQSGKKGKIEIEYYSRDELDRLVEILRSI